MKNENPTSDLSKFGFRELDMAGDLLKAYANDKYENDGDREILNEGLKIMFNLNSGEVFLTDDEYSVLILNDKGKLEAWLNCFNCGAEGFKSDKELEFIDGDRKSVV